MSQSYILAREAGTLLVQWVPMSAPRIYLGAGIILSLAGLCVFFGGRKLAGALKRAWNERVLTEGVWRAAGFLFIAGGLALAYSAVPKGSLVSWELGPESLAIKSLNGDVSLPWSGIRSARLDPRESRVENASLILTDDQGKDTWLILKWLAPIHRYAVVEELADRIPEVMKPILENKAYIEEIKE